MLGYGDETLVLHNTAIDMSFITGIGSIKSGDTERMLILVDIASMMSSAEMGLIDTVR